MSINVLFVCLGNICRSPSAEAVFRAKVAAAGLQRQIIIDSAGTSDWHIGKAPDPRSCQAALKRGYDLSSLRGRQVQSEDFRRFNYILAMDNANLSHLQAMAPADYSGTLELMLNFPVRQVLLEVPDPYFDAEQGFEQVLDLIETASDALLAHLQARLSQAN